MKKKPIVFIVIAIVMAIGSCNKSNHDKELDFLTEKLDEIEIADNYKWIVILPGLGCDGCIQVAEAFLQESLENNEVLFILTRIESIKILQNKLGIELKEHSNIFIDRNNLFNIPTDNTIYPCVIEISDGKIKEFEFQSPKNSQVFESLKSKL